MEELINSPEYQRLLPYVPYLLTAVLLRLILVIYLCVVGRNTILLIKEGNRCITSEQVWLLLIPFFNIYWNFVYMRRLVDSLNNEFYDRQIAVEENPTQKSGYFFAGSFLVYNFPLPLFVGFVAYILSIIALVLYIAKVKEYKKLLENDDLDFDKSI
ncbi:MAG: hypothetical protein ACI35V_11160 [Sphingobacterium composti]|uniref:hypothetical protein n=1 Tax=Sphingobacterium composti TaxID=363260 RepID=UPI00135C7C4E|nr:hypothetical protein [Sphingobacterium composti Ten et al. 2007 non Yoo et al. 2007]